MPTANHPAGCVPAEQGPWRQPLQGLRVGALDCLQTTVALIADRAYGTGAHLALGCRWRFPEPRPDGSVRVQRSLPERLDEAASLLGLRIAVPPGPVGPPELRRRLVGVTSLYVVADAYDLPWLPYAGHRHMPHSFLLEMGPTGYTVVDAYHNDTEWGAARPGAWALSADQLDRALHSGALAIAVDPAAVRPSLDRPAVVAANVAEARASGPGIEAYAADIRAALGQREGVERLVLDVWLLSRERLLHTAWLGDHPVAAQAAAAAAAWQRLAAQSYLVMRRARRGTPVNGAVADDLLRLLRADAALMGGLPTRLAGHSAGPPADAGPDRVLNAVVMALGDTLHLGPPQVRAAGSLRDLPGFDSFRLVEAIDRIEQRLGVRFPADAGADDLQDVPGLCRLFERGVAAGMEASR